MEKNMYKAFCKKYIDSGNEDELEEFIQELKSHLYASIAEK
jgi:hypothetical protein